MFQAPEHFDHAPGHLHQTPEHHHHHHHHPHRHHHHTPVTMDKHQTEIYNEVKYIESLQHHQAPRPTLSIPDLSNLNIPGSVLAKTNGLSFNIVGPDTKAVFKPDEKDHDKVTLVITGIEELGLGSVTETSKNPNTPGLAISGIGDIDLSPIITPPPPPPEAPSSQQEEKVSYFIENNFVFGSV